MAIPIGIILQIAEQADAYIDACTGADWAVTYERPDDAYEMTVAAKRHYDRLAEMIEAE